MSIKDNAMHSLGADLLVTWIAAIVLTFGFLLFGGASIQDRETMVITYGSIALILVGAIFVTIGQLIGFIGIW